ncbi:MAG: alpha-glucosidase AglA [Pseudothermotoga sp.]
MKISIVGAGSVRFALQLIGDIAQSEELSKVTVCLMDINEERLKTANILANKYVQELGSEIEIRGTQSLDEAIDGANFVINTAYPYDPRYLRDGYERWDKVTSIGEKHRYYRGIDSRELNMVSTYSYVLASYPDMKLAVDIAKKIEKYSPKAWLMQTANPVFEITQLVRRLTNANIIGFCHGVAGVYEVCKTLGLAIEEVDWQVAGVNHGIWLNRFFCNDKDAYVLLEEWIDQRSHEWQPTNPWDLQMSPAAIDMYKFYGMLPIGDTVRNGSWKYHYDLQTKKKWLGPYGGIDNEVERPRFHEAMREMRKKMFKLANDVKSDSKLKLTELMPDLFKKGKMSGEQHIPFIKAVTFGIKTRLVLNVLNKGTIKDLPDDVIVEVPVWVEGEKIQPEKIEPDLSWKIKYFYLLPRIAQMEMALEAFVSRDKKVLEEILVRDRRTTSFEQVKSVLDEIMFQPFNEEMRNYFGYSLKSEE